MDPLGMSGRPVCISSRRRTSFVPETTQPKRNERDHSNKRSAKSMKPITIPPLITARLVVRGLPHISGNRPRLIFG
jgi:hypothetical protein